MENLHYLNEKGYCRLFQNILGLSANQGHNDVQQYLNPHLQYTCLTLHFERLYLSSPPLNATFSLSIIYNILPLCYSTNSVNVWFTYHPHFPQTT